MKLIKIGSNVVIDMDYVKALHRGDNGNVLIYFKDNSQMAFQLKEERNLCEEELDEWIDSVIDKCKEG